MVGRMVMSKVWKLPEHRRTRGLASPYQAHSEGESHIKHTARESQLSTQRGIESHNQAHSEGESYIKHTVRESHIKQRGRESHAQSENLVPTISRRSALQEDTNHTKSLYWKHFG